VRNDEPWVAAFLQDDEQLSRQRQSMGNWRAIFEDARFEHLPHVHSAHARPRHRRSRAVEQLHRRCAARGAGRE